MVSVEIEYVSAKILDAFLYVNIKGKVSKDKKASMSRYLAKYLDNPKSLLLFRLLIGFL